jgi:hypothetical protein
VVGGGQGQKGGFAASELEQGGSHGGSFAPRGGSRHGVGPARERYGSGSWLEDRVAVTAQLGVVLYRSVIRYSVTESD